MPSLAPPNVGQTCGLVDYALYSRGLKAMWQASSVPVKYVFLDIVGFTQERSVEAQSFLIEQLDRIVQAELATHRLREEKLVLLPRGDGVCISLIDIGHIDIHLEIALGIISRIDKHNRSETNAMRRFFVRIGVNENVDILFKSAGGVRNVAGLGINMAQRIMSQAGAAQVLVGNSVYEILHVRDKYMNTFRHFVALDKHGKEFPAYQFIGDGNGLSKDVPPPFHERMRPS